MLNVNYVSRKYFETNSQLGEKKDILLKDIKTTSICLDLDLPEVLCCDNCKYKHPSNTAHLKKSLHAGVRFWKI